MPCVLYAIVPADGAPASAYVPVTCRPICAGDLVAITGDVPAPTDPATAALRHDQVIASALEVHRSLLPFRLGVQLPSAAAVERLLAVNAETLARALARLDGCVEMGLKAKLTESQCADAGVVKGSEVSEASHRDPSSSSPLRLPFGIERIRALAPRKSDRQEKICRAAGGTIFTGCYLVRRSSIEAFWTALDAIRRALPDLPMLGSGPWAPYSFADVVLGTERAGTLP